MDREVKDGFSREGTFVLRTVSEIGVQQSVAKTQALESNFKDKMSGSSCLNIRPIKS